MSDENHSKKVSGRITSSLAPTVFGYVLVLSFREPKNLIRRPKKNRFERQKSAFIGILPLWAPTGIVRKKSLALTKLFLTYWLEMVPKIGFKLKDTIILLTASDFITLVLAVDLPVAVK